MLATQDPTYTSLPFQVGGFVLLLVGIFTHQWIPAQIGTVVHLAGDTWFFFQLKARKAI